MRINGTFALLLTSKATKIVRVFDLLTTCEHGKFFDSNIGFYTVVVASLDADIPCRKILPVDGI